MRSQAREICLQILFQSEFTARISSHDFLNLLEDSVPKAVLDYAEILCEGIKNNQAAIDSSIQSASSHWSISRMSTVDRNILRMSVFEMKWAQDKIKPSISINEAIELAKKYGSTDSASFVNGVLDAISKDA